MEIYNIKDKIQYIEEIATLTQKEWGKEVKNNIELELKIKRKINKIINSIDSPDYCKLILLDDDNLVGFISIFPNDCKEKQDLKPWYSTMYIKEEYRGKGYSRLLNSAIIKEAKDRNYEKIYLKTNLKNYYEKFGFIYLEDLNNGEKLYYKKLM